MGIAKLGFRQRHRPIATHFYSDLLEYLAHKSSLYRHSEVFRSPLLFEDTMGRNSGKLQNLCLQSRESGPRTSGDPHRAQQGTSSAGLRPGIGYFCVFPPDLAIVAPPPLVRGGPSSDRIEQEMWFAPIRSTDFPKFYPGGQSEWSAHVRL
jgi:hypothetical protein